MFDIEPWSKVNLMAVPRPTFQQRLFSDDELPLQSHDRIVRWVDQSLKENAGPILTALGIEHVRSGSNCVGWGPGTIWADVSGHRHALASAINVEGPRFAPSLPAPPPIEVSNIRWEPILKDERGTIIGAVDLWAYFKVPYPTLHISCSDLGYALRELEKKLISLIPSDREFLFWDGRKTWIDRKLVENGIIERLPAEGIGVVATKEGALFLRSASYTAKHEFRDFSLFVEAKTKIRSVGELMRQMNLYRTTVKSGSRFLVTAPSSEWDAGTKAILNEQGLATVDYLAN